MDLHQYVPGSMAGWMSLALRGWKREADLYLEIDDRSGSTTRHQQPNTGTFFFFFGFQPVDIGGNVATVFFWRISGMVIFDLSIWFTIGDNWYFWIMTRIIRPMYWPDRPDIGWNYREEREKLRRVRGENFCGLFMQFFVSLIIWPLFWQGSNKQCNCIVILRDFPCNSALFGLVKKWPLKCL